MTNELPIIKTWNDVPATHATKTTLMRKGLWHDGMQPEFQKKGFRNKIYLLYDAGVVVANVPNKPTKSRPIKPLRPYIDFSDADRNTYYLNLFLVNAFHLSRDNNELYNELSVFFFDNPFSDGANFVPTKVKSQLTEFGMIFKKFGLNACHEIVNGFIAVSNTKAIVIDDFDDYMTAFEGAIAIELPALT